MCRQVVNNDPSAAVHYKLTVAPSFSDITLAPAEQTVINSIWNQCARWPPACEGSAGEQTELCMGANHAQLLCCITGRVFASRSCAKLPSCLSALFWQRLLRQPACVPSGVKHSALQPIMSCWIYDRVVAPDRCCQGSITPADVANANASDGAVSSCCLPAHQHACIIPMRRRCEHNRFFL